MAKGVMRERIIKQSKEAHMKVSLNKSGLWSEEQVQHAAHEIYLLHSCNGGATYRIGEGSLTGQKGYAISMFKDRETVIVGNLFRLSQEFIEMYINFNLDILASDRDTAIGTWYDSRSNKIYLDIVKVINDRAEAIKIARENKQEAIFNLETMEEIRI